MDLVIGVDGGAPRPRVLWRISKLPGPGPPGHPSYPEELSLRAARPRRRCAMGRKRPCAMQAFVCPRLAAGYAWRSWRWAASALTG